jgi:muramoyltetrapeptide carboxypeptidase
VLFPPPLKRGDTIAVIAPSSPFEHVLGWRGLGFLAERYRLRFDRRALFARRGYLAGEDGARRDALGRALEDPDVAAILAARGGYGANRFVHGVDFAGLRARPRWIIGFSDITALHVEASRVGVASLHACHLTALGRSDGRARAGLLQALEDPLGTRVFDGLRAIVAPGRAEGPLFGGNLTMLHACAAAGRLVVPEGAIVFLEDVTERPYRIDRMLTTLAVGGHLEPRARLRGGGLHAVRSGGGRGDGRGRRPRPARRPGGAGGGGGAHRPRARERARGRGRAHRRGREPSTRPQWCSSRRPETHRRGREPARGLGGALPVAREPPRWTQRADVARGPGSPTPLGRGRRPPGDAAAAPKKNERRRSDHGRGDP